MADAAGARLFVPVHHQSFRLSREPYREPIERTQEALAREPERLAIREMGRTRAQSCNATSPDVALRRPTSARAARRVVSTTEKETVSQRGLTYHGGSEITTQE